MAQNRKVIAHEIPVNGYALAVEANHVLVAAVDANLRRSCTRSKLFIRTWYTG